MIWEKQRETLNGAIAWKWVTDESFPTTNFYYSDIQDWAGLLRTSEPAAGALVVPSEESALLAPPKSDGSAAGAQELDGLLLRCDLSSAAYA
jgi:hypothetical protein